MENEIVLSECFELQLSETEMLRSMYPTNEEFTMSFPSVVTDMTGFVSGKSKYLPNQLDFTLNLKIQDIKDKLELNVSFPHKYPFMKPEACARSAGFTRPQQKQLNTDMEDYIQSLASGDLCILPLINWLMENAGKYYSLNSHIGEDDAKEESGSNNRDILCRMWIYSHHIYNKFKRKEIVECAEDLNLSGFSLPGKPGFICIEGFKTDCSEFLQNLKQMSWKKISLVKEEIEESVEIDVKQFRKFDSFSEISFEVRRGPAREYHMDMGQFLKFLTEHDSAYAFQDLFGLEGQTSSAK